MKRAEDFIMATLSCIERIYRYGRTFLQLVTAINFGLTLILQYNPLEITRSVFVVSLMCFAVTIYGKSDVFCCYDIPYMVSLMYFAVTIYHIW